MHKNIRRKLIISLFLVFAGIITSIFLYDNLINNLSEVYLSSDTPNVILYDKELNEVNTLVRGTKVLNKGNYKNDYYKISYDNKEYIIKKNNVTTNEIDIVMEQKMYVRTPVTIYLKDDLSLIKKGEEVQILSYDKINEKGIVNLYKVKYDDLEGEVYGKYLVNNHEDSLKNYDEESTYQTHLSRTNTLGGGAAGNLDFYPFEKKAIPGNDMPKEVRALYLNGGAIKNVDNYIAVAKKSNINAFVVDIKENYSPTYQSLVMKKYSPTNYDHASMTMDQYRSYIKKLKDNGFYVIGRITVFKDSYYVIDHPEDAIGDNRTGGQFEHNGSYWPSAFQRSVWLYNVELAKEAVVEMGFNEIQFDYIRFPDRTYSLEKSGVMDMKNTFNEEKAQAIQTFLMYAADELHSVNAYISGDVFGEAAHRYVTGYGQYWGAISNIVDVISPMPYPDHFGSHEYNIEEVVWTVPYKLLNFWATNYVVKAQEEIPTPAVVRSWVQAYSTTKQPYVFYDSDKVSDQIQALYDAGLDGGYMTWNASSNIDKYSDLQEAFKKEY